MDGKRTVYSVSSGEYSDYGILDLFEDRTDAEAVAARNPKDWRVEEFNLYPPGTREILIPRRRFSARMLVNGDGRILDHVRVHDWYDYPDDGPEEPTSVTYQTIWPSSIDGVHVPERVGQPYEVHASADSEEQVRKTVRERAAKVAATLIDGGTPETPWRSGRRVSSSRWS